MAEAAACGLRKDSKAFFGKVQKLAVDGAASGDLHMGFGLEL
jgi:hypothetical protein